VGDEPAYHAPVSVPTNRAHAKGHEGRHHPAGDADVAIAAGTDLVTHVTYRVLRKRGPLAGDSPNVRD
jgi:hypothetical protein